MTRRRIPVRTLVILVLLLAALALASCSAATGIPTATPAPFAIATGTVTGALLPIVVPSLPAVIPAYLAVDPDTGLHMTGKPTVVDFYTYRFTVSGKVDRALSLTYDDLRLLPKMTATPVLICEGAFVDEATWSGVPLATLLEMAGVQTGATSISLVSADGYKTSLTMQEALGPDNFLAYELMGRTLPILQGFPLRAVLPGLQGYKWVKWLTGIVVE